MGLLDQILGGGAAAGSAQAARNRSLNTKLAAGVLVALAVKAMRDRQHSAQDRPPPVETGLPQSGRSRGSSGGFADILGGLGGVLGGGAGGGGGALGGILGSLGGAGALGGLISALQQKGHGSQVNSWVGAGANQPVEPHELGVALGEDVVADLQQQTGLPRDQMLAQLAEELPEAVNHATPEGRLPTDDELRRAVGG
jgi:uncharacterized protein YidB (DUF937 family)